MYAHGAVQPATHPARHKAGRGCDKMCSLASTQNEGCERWPSCTVGQNRGENKVILLEPNQRCPGPGTVVRDCWFNPSLLNTIMQTDRRTEGWENDYFCKTSLSTLRTCDKVWTKGIEGKKMWQTLNSFLLLKGVSSSVSPPFCPRQTWAGRQK